ncbi:glycosyltransferase family 2 protein [Allobaculum mucilyticum]|uniref:glycosyltransferase family 2 protein n=1 Tax=Allobaculum mucilyticum TaxID=2834459 RepID=UPI001E5DB74F|nr:glycosyltransferase family 2 protein [Allobaculum mucilyticum]UNT95028.1 glycosyltransferase family 2 protein [Allobaculum mucilyticum]
MNKSVDAVVVTYNRKEMLIDTIHSILNQTYPVHRLILVDNHSTDGTLDYLKEKGILNDERIDLVSLSENTGGAGGFHAGMKRSREIGDADWVWIMDDDVEPVADCLEELLKAEEKLPKPVSFLASSIRGMNDEPMNVPKLPKGMTTGYVDWYKYLGEGMVNISKATFVSLLINTEAIKKCGLPWAPFFIWGDDSEYTQRVIRDFGPAYMVGKSQAIHKRKSADALSIVKEDNPNRINMFFYYYRNNLIGYWEYEGALNRFLCMGKLGYDFVNVIFKGKYKFRKMGVILKAFNAFVFGTYDRNSFKHRSEI